VRELHLVGFTPDHKALILAGKRDAEAGAYTLLLDDAVLSQIDTARRARSGQGPPDSGRPARVGVGSSLSPREIQSQLRAGRSVLDVAADAGVSTDWIDRFAAPVRAEQAAAVDRAARAVLHLPRRGASERPLEAAVLRNLGERGVVMTRADFDAAWSASHLLEGDWLISFQFPSRKRTVVAEWVLDSARGVVAARNRLGAELGFFDPDRPPPSAAVDPAAPETLRLDLEPAVAGQADELPAAGGSPISGRRARGGRAAPPGPPRGRAPAVVTLAGRGQAGPLAGPGPGG
jgi:hypothetical protein